MNRAWLAGLGLVVSVGAAPSTARADKPTSLLEDDLRANRRKAIDAPSDADDAALDSVLGAPSGFSTQELGKVEDRIRAELKRDRPRASPRLVVFEYPGRVSAERLRAMREVLVDIELTIDPCSRSLCDDALAHHIEMVGRAVGKATGGSTDYTLKYKTLTLKAETDVRGDELITMTMTVAEAISASQRAGGGMALIESRRHADTDYVPLMTKAIAQKANIKRVPLTAPPKVSRDASGVSVTLSMKGDRARQDQQVLDALSAIADALATSPATPAQGRIEIDVAAASRSVGPVRFRCPLDPAQRYGRGELDAKQLLASYVEHVNDDKNATHLELSDSQGPEDEGSPPDDAEAINAISASFSSVGACAKAEAASNSRFHGVTVLVTWTGSGRVTNVDVKEAALKGGALPGCLRGAFQNISLPHFSGASHTIQYPIRLK